MLVYGVLPCLGSVVREVNNHGLLVPLRIRDLLPLKVHREMLPLQAQVGRDVFRKAELRENCVGDGGEEGGSEPELGAEGVCNVGEGGAGEGEGGGREFEGIGV